MLPVRLGAVAPASLPPDGAVDRGHAEGELFRLAPGRFGQWRKPAHGLHGPEDRLLEGRFAHEDPGIDLPAAQGHAVVRRAVETVRAGEDGLERHVRPRQGGGAERGAARHQGERHFQGIGCDAEVVAGLDVQSGGRTLPPAEVLETREDALLEASQGAEHGALDLELGADRQPDLVTVERQLHADARALEFRGTVRVPHEPQPGDRAVRPDEGRQNGSRLSVPLDPRTAPVAGRADGQEVRLQHDGVSVGLGAKDNDAAPQGGKPARFDRHGQGLEGSSSARRLRDGERAASFDHTRPAVEGKRDGLLRDVPEVHDHAGRGRLEALDDEGMDDAPVNGDRVDLHPPLARSGIEPEPGEDPVQLDRDAVLAPFVIVDQREAAAALLGRMGMAVRGPEHLTRSSGRAPGAQGHHQDRPGGVDGHSQVGIAARRDDREDAAARRDPALIPRRPPLGSAIEGPLMELFGGCDFRRKGVRVLACRMHRDGRGPQDRQHEWEQVSNPATPSPGAAFDHGVSPEVSITGCEFILYLHG